MNAYLRATRAPGGARVRRLRLPVLLLTALVATTHVTAEDLGSPRDLAFFESKVRPLLVSKCYRCHSEEAGASKGGLILDRRRGWEDGGDSGPAVVPGDPDASRLIHAVRRTGKLAMPPKAPLSESEVAVLVAWVQRGAVDPRVETSPESVERAPFDLEAARSWWAFRPLGEEPPPDVENESWPRGPIDRFILARLEAEGLSPVADADPRTLVRRVYFDLTGLPPDPDAVEAFARAPTREAFAALVDRLLESERFGERWGRHWLDIARYAESTGRTRNYPFPFAWRYRDWVIDAFNADLPHDTFIRHQVAGDLLPADSAEARDAQRIATGFLALGSKDLNERNAEQFRMDNVDDQIDTLGRAVLGLTIGCARCHDHKFDPIPQTDYYALAGIFRSTDQLVGLSRQGGGKRQGVSALVRLESIAHTDDEAEREDPATDRRAERAAKQIAALEKKLEGIAEEIANAPKSGRRAGRRSAEEREAAARAQERVAELRKEQRTLQGELKTLVRKRNQNIGNPDIPRRGPFAMGVADDERPSDARVAIRGEPSHPGESVPRGGLQVLPGHAFEISADTSGRLEVAAWLTSAANPLTPRVAVNRIWQHLFGNGLVRTVDNFGSSGERPSHPALLDWLAREFQTRGRSTKSLIREIVLSRTYALSSALDERGWEQDPDNRLLWRANQRRLDAESLRDAVLAISGELDLTRPEGSVVSDLPGGEIRSANVLGKELFSRSVYLPIVRSALPDFLETFDVADPSMVIGRRDVTTVATQALYLLNSPFVLERARRFGDRVRGDARRVEDGVDLAFRLAYSRPPTGDETRASIAFIEDMLSTAAVSGEAAEELAWSSFTQALLASAEFRYLQ